jgi:hypothetical protein
LQSNFFFPSPKGRGVRYSGRFFSRAMQYSEYPEGAIT